MLGVALVAVVSYAQTSPPDVQSGVAALSKGSQAQSRRRQEEDSPPASSCGVVDPKEFQSWDGGFVVQVKVDAWTPHAQMTIHFKSKVVLTKSWGALLSPGTTLADYKGVDSVQMQLGEFKGKGSFGVQGTGNIGETSSSVSVTCNAPPPSPPAAPIPCAASGEACWAPLAPKCCAEPGEGCMKRVDLDTAICRYLPEGPCRDTPDWLCPGWHDMAHRPREPPLPPPSPLPQPPPATSPPPPPPPPPPPSPPPPLRPPPSNPPPASTSIVTFVLFTIGGAAVLGGLAGVFIYKLQSKHRNALTISAADGDDDDDDDNDDVDEDDEETMKDESSQMKP